MYGYNFNPQVSIDRINQQISELEKMKSNFQNVPQPQPIQNIINTNSQNIDFEARIINENEKVDEILVTRRTAFISPENGYLKIKEIDGTITEYGLIVPKTPEQLKIEELERRLSIYEQSNNSTDIEVTEPLSNDNEQNDTTTKNNSRAIFKKSK